MWTDHDEQIRALLATYEQSLNTSDAAIEGYTVSEQDAVAAVDEEPPLSADERTWAEIIGYRRLLTYILRMAPEPGFGVDSQLLRSLHFMLLAHDLVKDPGRFRAAPVYVQDESTGEVVYEGPDADLVPGLVDQLARGLNAERGEPMVVAAMAHLNLVMIHPFRDGNGRMARALQTLVMARDQVLEPTFSSVEEWLGANTEDYYRVLTLTGGGGWNPGNDAGWVKFNLRAHHMQAQTLQRRFREAEATWSVIDALITEHGLPERVGDPLFDAILGYRVRRPCYVRRAGIEERTATRDLNRLVTAGLLDAVGQTRGRYHTAGQRLRRIALDARSTRTALTDPYPWLPTRLRTGTT
jgi:Fic family protein